MPLPPPIFTAQLAQIGISPEGLLDGALLAMLLLAAWILFTLLSLLLLILGLIRLSKRRGKILVTASSLSLLTLAVLMYLAIRPPPLQTFSADFSSSRAIPPGHWIALFGSEITLDLQGRIDAHIRLPDNHSIDGRVFSVSLEADHSHITQVLVLTPEMPLDPACDLAQKYITAWHLDEKYLPAWHADRKANKDPNLAESEKFFSYQNDTNPALALEINKGFAPGDSWCLSLEATWDNPETTTHP